MVAAIMQLQRRGCGSHAVWTGRIRLPGVVARV